MAASDTSLRHAKVGDLLRVLPVYAHSSPGVPVAFRMTFCTVTESTTQLVAVDMTPTGKDLTRIWLYRDTGKSENGEFEANLQTKKENIVNNRPNPGQPAPTPVTAQPIAPPTPDAQKTTENLIKEEIISLEEMLLAKNRKYGDSAIHPKRVFSKSGPIEQINVRMDDKLSRIESRQTDDDEDPELDLIGYLILKRVARRVHLCKGDA